MRNSSLRVGVFGCGWLGQPLATKLIQSGYQVIGSTTRESQFEVLSALGITPVKLNLRQHPLAPQDYQSVSQLDVILINIPPKRRDLDALVFVSQVKQFIETLLMLSPQAYVIFVSTTSVFGKAAHEVDEHTPTCPNTPSGEAHVELEQYILKQPKSCVVRLAGLIDNDRHPITSIVKRETFNNGQQRVNLVHQDDVVTALHIIIMQQPSSVTLHLCAPEHPTREDYYQYAAQQRFLTFPNIIPDPKRMPHGKVVLTQKTQQLLGFEYQYKSPYDML